MELSNQGQDKTKEVFPDWMDEDDLFGLKVDMEIILFKCLDCGGTDEVPEYIIGKFSVDKNNRGKLKSIVLNVQTIWEIPHLSDLK